MASFNVENYTVSVGANRHDRYDPSIRLTSNDLSHGIRNRANLVFAPVPTSIANNNAIGYLLNVGGANFNGITVVAYLGGAAFDDIYSIVRNESPIIVTYSYKDLPSPNHNSTTKYLTYIKVGTEGEIPGEGDRDSNAEIMEVEALLNVG